MQFALCSDTVCWPSGHSLKPVCSIKLLPGWHGRLVQVRGSLRLLSPALCTRNWRPLAPQPPASDLKEWMYKQCFSLAITCPFQKLPLRILGGTRQRINTYINNKFKIFQMVAWKNRTEQNKQTKYLKALTGNLLYSNGLSFQFHLKGECEPFFQRLVFST